MQHRLLLFHEAVGQARTMNRRWVHAAAVAAAASCVAECDTPGVDGLPDKVQSSWMTQVMVERHSRAVAAAAVVWLGLAQSQ